MIGDDFGKVRGLCPFRNNRRGVRNVLEQRTVSKKCAACNEYDLRIRPSVAGEISNRDCAALFQHDIQDQDLGFVLTKVVDRVLLIVDDVNDLVLPLEVPCPYLCKFAI